MGGEQRVPLHLRDQWTDAVRQVVGEHDVLRRGVLGGIHLQRVGGHLVDGEIVLLAGLVTVRLYRLEHPDILGGDGVGVVVTDRGAGRAGRVGGGRTLVRAGHACRVGDGLSGAVLPGGTTVAVVVVQVGTLQTGLSRRRLVQEGGRPRSRWHRERGQHVVL